jgi:hypothetical protein
MPLLGQDRLRSILQRRVNQDKFTKIAARSGSLNGSFSHVADKPISYARARNPICKLEKNMVSYMGTVRPLFTRRHQGGYRMRIRNRVIVLMLALGLVFGTYSSAAAQSSSVGIHSIAACKDSTTVAVIGSSSFATNRVRATVYTTDADGKDVMLDREYTESFGSGRVSVAIVLNYRKRPVSANTTLRVEVQLERLSGNSFVGDGAVLTQYAVAADKSCLGLCTVTVDTADGAPADGTLTLRSHYGTWFRPEGRLYGAVPVRAGRQLRATFVGLPCNWSVRAWYYPGSGDTMPKMLPAQYWPNEYAATVADGTNPYTTSFAAGLPATHPLEDDDVFVAR